VRLRYTHPWDVTPQQAIRIQQELRDAVITKDQLGPVRFVAGIDVGFEQSRTVTRAGVAVLRLPELKLCEHVMTCRPTRFPYIPGLLAFREIPAMLDALAKTQQVPDLLLCDGQGLAHPRRFGIACHLGVLTDIPSIGVAKTRLLGEHEPVPDARGAWRVLTHDGEIVGAALRSRVHTKPLYVSPGHRVSLPVAIRCVMACTTRYRLPETTRWAHRLASGRGEACS
jgi:Deoxyinosine 3''endonuclease (endonuclease V)